MSMILNLSPIQIAAILVCSFLVLITLRNTIETIKLMAAQTVDIAEIACLIRFVDLIRATATPTGLMFTAIGLVVVLFQQSQSLAQAQMLGDISMALLSTVLAVIIFIWHIVLRYLLINKVLVAQGKRSSKKQQLERVR